MFVKIAKTPSRTLTPVSKYPDVGAIVRVPSALPRGQVGLREHGERTVAMDDQDRGQGRARLDRT